MAVDRASKISVSAAVTSPHHSPMRARRIMTRLFLDRLHPSSNGYYCTRRRPQHSEVRRASTSQRNEAGNICCTVTTRPMHNQRLNLLFIGELGIPLARPRWYPAFRLSEADQLAVGHVGLSSESWSDRLSQCLRRRARAIEIERQRRIGIAVSSSGISSIGSIQRKGEAMTQQDILQRNIR